MKIACLTTSQAPANTANSIQAFKACHALAQGGAQVCLWVAAPPSGASWDALSAFYGLRTSFEVRWLPSRPGWRRYDLIFAGLWAARRWGADALVTWLVQAAVLGSKLGLPVVYEMHDRPTGQFGAWWLRQLARVQRPKRVLMITRALRRVVESEFGIRFADEDVQIAPNGIEWERFEHLPNPVQARLALGLKEMPTAVYTGHFYAGRGMTLLCSLAQALPQVQFLWVGGREADVEVWRQRTQHLANVILTGFVENQRLPLYQAAGEVLLMPYERAIAGSSGGNSAEICSPMKMFEYMACGRAILSSDLPVLHEVLNEENAVFCPPEEPTAWVKALDELIRDGERGRRLGFQARRDAQRYTWQQRAGGILDWLNSLSA
ncbi:MAG: glycosyltransferase family 4 protein [Anaerolinea sp.]|nr:glycosyltransferase family 4 protein [Anaerolinea sp.]